MRRGDRREARVAALAAALLGGRRGEVMPSSADPDLADELLEHLGRCRLAAEVAALPASRRSLPAAVRRALAVERERVRVAAGSLRRCLDHAGSALARAGLEAVLYKGQAAWRLTHGDASRRPMADVDLLVRPEERAAAAAALERGGLGRTPHDTVLHDVFLDEGARGPGHPRGVTLELHGDVFPPPHPFALDLEGVRRRARPSEIAGLLLPDVRDAFALAAFHLVLYEQDGRKTLQELRDLALLSQALGSAHADPVAALVEVAAEGDLLPVVSEAARRARDWAGAADWTRGLPEARCSSRRRRLALRLALAELDRCAASSRPREAGRTLGRRLAAALWWESRVDCARALARGVSGRGEGAGVAASARRLARHALALARLAGAPDRSR